MENKKTYEGIPNPAEPEKKKQKSDSAFVQFLETFTIINIPLLSRIVEFDNSNNDLDYIVVMIHV